MKAHKGLTRLDVLKYPPSKIALMVASEFLRASDKLQYPQVAQNSFSRARELMGVLETTDLDSESAIRLQPYYGRCSEERLCVSDRTSREELRAFCLEVANVFETAFIPREGKAHA